MSVYDYACRVCGLAQGDKPWGDDGKCPTYFICRCCGVEFGLGDEAPSDARYYRNWWIEKGMPWWNPKAKPENWDPEEQFKNIPPEFR